MDNKQEIRNPVVAYYQISKEIDDNDANINRIINQINIESKNTKRSNKKTKYIIGWCMIILSILCFVSLPVVWWDEKRIISNYEGYMAKSLESELINTLVTAVWGAIVFLVCGIVLIWWDKHLLKKQEEMKQQHVNELVSNLTSFETKKHALAERQKKVLVEYQNSAYYQITQNEIDVLRTDAGKMGEYLIYEAIKPYAKEGAHFLFNLYIPSIDDKTTEIDVLMICKKGIIVFESKNYSGWIGGSEEDKQWTQVLRNERGREWKEKFYNPILQNQLHIDSLKKIVGDTIPMYSMVVFSDKCILNKSFVSQKGVCVIQCKDVPLYIKLIFEKKDIRILEDGEIVSLYEKLIPYTEASEESKLKHIEDLIRDRIKNV